MIGIQTIAWATGATVVDNRQSARLWDKDEAFIVDKVGFRSLRRLAAGQSSQSLCREAFADLQKQTGLAVEECDCLVVVTQNPDARRTVPHTSAQLHGALKLLPSVAAFDISLGCSGYVYAISVMSTFMQANGLKKGLLFTADAYSPALQQEDEHTQLLFGDAVACTLLSDNPHYIVGKSCFATLGEAGHALWMHDDGHISMKGREIFNFCMRSVPMHLAECLKKNSLNPDEIDCLVLHQASRYIVEALGRKAGFPSEKVPFVLGDVGNCISSTIPITLEKIWRQNHKRILVSGFGAGLSWATTVLHRYGE